MATTVPDTAAIPTAECDLILRGGIASGVVYPGTLVRLAQSWRFRNVGGASAGAIAAAVAVAAEYGRQNGRPDSFTNIVAGVPAEIGGENAGRGGTSFKQLFAAHPALARVMALVWKALDAKSAGGGMFGIMIACLPAVLMALWGAALLGLLLAAVLVVGFVAAITGAIGPTPAVIAGIIGLALLLWCLLIPIRAIQMVPPLLAAHGFGLCGGANADLRSSTDTAEYVAKGALSDWLHATLQRAAGREVGDKPLTMGDLWGHDDPWNADRAIDLVLTTTNLSHQVPHSFPFLERSALPLYFRREDLLSVLPAPVVDHLCNFGSDAGAGYRRLPPPHQLPVLLGVRMSLSFPVLISAVRLHVDTPDGRKACWFTDGGITSNFPITAFDSPLPRRPTFCINLRDVEGLTSPDPVDRIELVRSNSERIPPIFQKDLDASGLGGFVGAILETSRNATENELMTMPCNRDRIATVKLNPDCEGGINLTMGPAAIRQLGAFGTAAAAALTARFHPDDAVATDPPMGWSNHRWMRLRTTLAGIETLLVRVAAGLRHVHPDGETYEGILAASAPKPRVRAATEVATPTDAGLTDAGVAGAHGYRWHSRAHFDRASAQAAAVADTARAVEAAADRPLDSVFDGPARDPANTIRRADGAPRPRMGMRLRPVGRDPLIG